MRFDKLLVRYMSEPEKVLIGMFSDIERGGRPSGLAERKENIASASCWEYEYEYE